MNKISDEKLITYLESLKKIISKDENYDYTILILNETIYRIQSYKSKIEELNNLLCNYHKTNRF